MAGSEQVSWILRHVGPPPTIKGIVNVVELKPGTTTFGRGAGVDVYIDSLVLRNFISRRHAVIIGEKSDVGQLQFILHNHGLNGTYVNDVRIGTEKHLSEGDKVIFGHTNGYKVKVGETALQPNSEFQFILECIRSSKSAVVPLKEQRQLKDCEPVPLPAVYTPRCNGQSVSDSSQDVILAPQKIAAAEASPLSSSAGGGTTSSLKDDSQRSCTENCNPSSKTPPGKGSSEASGVFIAKENKESRFMTIHKKFIESSVLTVSRGLPDDKNLIERDCASEQTAISAVNVPGKQKRTPSVSSARSDSSQSDNSVSKSPVGTKHFRRSRSDKQELPSEKTPSQGLKKCHDKPTSPQRDRSRSPLERTEMDGRARSKRDNLFEPDSQMMKKTSPLAKSSRRSESPGPRFDKTSSESPKHAVRRKSRSSSLSSQTSCESEKSVYDEPPVLSPELDYVKTPSSDVRTPSPCIPTDRASDYEFDVIDDIDRDYNVPPTPGRSLHELSPAPHLKHDNFSQSKLQEVSPQVKKWLFGDHEDKVFEDEEVTVDRGIKSSPQAKAKNACGHSKTPDSRSVDKKRSKIKNSHILDSRSPDKDRTKKGLENQSSRAHHKNADQTKAALATEQISRADLDTPAPSNKSKAGERSPGTEQKGDFRKEQTEKSNDRIRNKNKEKNGDRDIKEVSERNFRKSEKNKSGDQLNRLQIQPLNKHSKSPDHQKSKIPSQRSSKSPSAHSEKDAKSGCRDTNAPKNIHAEGNIFEKFWAERHSKPEQTNSRKRQRSKSPEGGSEEKSSRPQPKAARADETSRKGHTESKENGSTQKCGSSDKQGDAGSKKDHDKIIRNGKLSSEAYVSLKKVTQGSSTATRVEDKESLRASVTDGQSKCSGKSKDSDKHAGSSNRISKTITKKANDEEEESLFGRHLKSLGTVTPRERSKKQKQPIEPKETPTTFIKSSKDTLSKRPKDVKSRKTDTLYQETRGADCVRNGKSGSSDNRQRHSSSESQSSSPDFAFSEDERSKSLRKVALRRPQPPQDNKSQTNDSGRLSDRKSGSGQQPMKRGRRRKRKKKSSDDDDLDDDLFDEDGEDEDLPEGVTWYEEENCASNNCCRPAEKRVQWVCCDDCDKWYHTVCVGIAAFAELKDEDFHCGCV